MYLFFVNRPSNIWLNISFGHLKSNCSLALWGLALGDDWRPQWGFNQITMWVFILCWLAWTGNLFKWMGPTFEFGMIGAPILLAHAHRFDDASWPSRENVDPLQLNPARNSAGFSEGRLDSWSNALPPHSQHTQWNCPCFTFSGGLPLPADWRPMQVPPFVGASIAPYRKMWDVVEQWQLQDSQKQTIISLWALQDMPGSMVWNTMHWILPWCAQTSCTDCGVCRFVAGFVAESLISRLCGSSWPKTNWRIGCPTTRWRQVNGCPTSFLSQTTRITNQCCVKRSRFDTRL